MDNKLKIAIGTDAFPPTTDGVCNVVKNYAEHLNKSHCTASVITPKNPNAEDEKYNYEIFRYKSWFIPSRSGYSIGWPFKESLSYEIINRGFDLLHSHCPLATSYYFRLVNDKKRIPVVLTYHTKYEYDFERVIPTKPAKDFAYSFLLNNINSADEVWVTSEGTGESLRKVGYTGDYVVMPNGCDMPKRSFSEDEIAAIKLEMNIPQDIPVFIYAGRMIWYKNIRLILDACKKLKDMGEDFKLIMLGFGDDEIFIRHYYKKLGLSDRIIWTKKITDRQLIQKYYAVSDVLIFPSVFDTNGLVVREAASCATPSLLIKDSCAAEGVEDGVNGFLCEESVDSIAAKLLEIMHNREFMAEVGRGAQRDIYISWEYAVAKAYERYQVVIDNFYKNGEDKKPYQYLQLKPWFKR